MNLKRTLALVHAAWILLASSFFVFLMVQVAGDSSPFDPNAEALAVQFEEQANRKQLGADWTTDSFALGAFGLALGLPSGVALGGLLGSRIFQRRLREGK